MRAYGVGGGCVVGRVPLNVIASDGGTGVMGQGLPSGDTDHQTKFYLCACYPP